MNTFSSSKHNRERGIAMFVVMFALLLLSVIGLGMMYSTNTETAINSNYKDSQIAIARLIIASMAAAFGFPVIELSNVA